jgi:dTDP-4-amino-4,6-dideoxygalactose transaminase
MLGLNGKLSETGALLGRLQLHGYDQVMDHRASLMQLYRQHMPELKFQSARLARQAHQFAPVLLPADIAGHRSTVLAGMAADSIGTASYFSPHLAEQVYFQDNAVSGKLPVTNAVAGRIISLPLFDTMDRRAVRTVCASLRRQIAIIRAQHAPMSGATPCRPADEPTSHIVPSLPGTQIIVEERPS